MTIYTIHKVEYSKTDDDIVHVMIPPSAKHITFHDGYVMYGFDVAK